MVGGFFLFFFVVLGIPAHCFTGLMYARLESRKGVVVSRLGITTTPEGLYWPQHIEYYPLEPQVCAKKKEKKRKRRRRSSHNSDTWLYTLDVASVEPALGV